MQILPLVTARSQAAADGIVQSNAVASQQSAMFASLLDSARAATSTRAATAASAPTAASAEQASTGSSRKNTSSASSGTIGDALEASQTPSNQELMSLPMTREDLAALHDDLTNQGFSEDEISALQEKIDSPKGLTWGEMMGVVKKKVAKSQSSEKKEISNEDTVQMLGLFGKLGFTADESQKMVDSLAKGETESVWSAVNAKVAEIAATDSVSLTSTEMATLGKAMNLSDEAQSRLTALFNQSTAESGLSGQSLAAAFGLVQNEILSQIGQENQSMAEFRQAASLVLDKAWQNQQNKLNSGLHQDDVARKAAQVVAMGGEKKTDQTVPTASQPGIDVLADVPEAGAAPETTQAQSQADGAIEGGARQAGNGANAAAQLQSRAGVVATEQAAVSGQSSAQAPLAQLSAEAQTGQEPAAAGTTQTQTQAASKTTAAAPQFTGNGTGGFAAGQQGGGAGGSFEQAGQEGGWGEFWSKVRVDKTAGQSTASSHADSTATMAAMDAVTGSRAGLSAKTFDPGLAARAARQLETGILRNVGQDAKQLTLKLTPDELGTLSVTITVKDKEVRAVITADNPDTAAMLNDQAAHIKKTLEDQGFKVTKLDVQTGVAQDNQTAWQSPEQHNQAREQREAMERLRSTQRLAREGVLSTTDDAMGFVPQAAMTGASGLDLFA